MNKGRYHWSNLARECLFFVVHWIAAVPFLLLIFVQSWTLLFVAISMFFVLLYIRKVSKMTLPSAARAIGCALVGKQKVTSNWFKGFIQNR